MGPFDKEVASKAEDDRYEESAIDRLGYPICNVDGTQPYLGQE